MLFFFACTSATPSTKSSDSASQSAYDCWPHQSFCGCASSVHYEQLPRRRQIYQEVGRQGRKGLAPWSIISASLRNASIPASTQTALSCAPLKSSVERASSSKFTSGLVFIPLSMAWILRMCARAYITRNSTHAPPVVNAAGAAAVGVGGSSQGLVSEGGVHSTFSRCSHPRWGGETQSSDRYVLTAAVLDPGYRSGLSPRSPEADESD